jgi:hypothetical protein
VLSENIQKNTTEMVVLQAVFCSYPSTVLVDYSKYIPVFSLLLCLFFYLQRSFKRRDVFELLMLNKFPTENNYLKFLCEDLYALQICTSEYIGGHHISGAKNIGNVGWKRAFFRRIEVLRSVNFAKEEHK